MRVKIELLVFAVLTIAVSLAYAAPMAGYKCQGLSNCQMVNCQNAGGYGYSCAVVTPINHKSCDFTGLKDRHLHRGHGTMSP